MEYGIETAAEKVTMKNRCFALLATCGRKGYDDDCTHCLTNRPHILTLRVPKLCVDNAAKAVLACSLYSQ